MGSQAVYAFFDVGQSSIPVISAVSLLISAPGGGSLNFPHQLVGVCILSIKLQNTSQFLSCRLVLAGNQESLSLGKVRVQQFAFELTFYFRQVECKFACRLVPLLSMFGERPLNDAFQLCRISLHVLMQWSRGAAHHLVQSFRNGVSGERKVPAQQLV